MKPRPCTHCHSLFTPQRMGQRVCSPICAIRFVKAEQAQEKAELKQRKQKAKSRGKWEEECRRIVQKIARIRDRNDGCISCHLPSTWGGQWHGSHYRSHGAASAVQFHLWNIHKSCSSCNRDKGGNIIDYTPRLIAKIGQEKVDWLMAQNSTSKPPIEYYIRFKSVMGKRLRRLEKRLGASA